MGSCDFQNTAKGTSAAAAFASVVSRARRANGDDGYTGTIAEKGDFVMYTVPPGQSVQAFIDACMADDHHPCQNKWGPAACVQKGPDEWIFFGYASC